MRDGQRPLARLGLNGLSAALAASGEAVAENAHAVFARDVRGVATSAADVDEVATCLAACRMACEEALSRLNPEVVDEAEKRAETAYERELGGEL